MVSRLGVDAIKILSCCHSLSSMSIFNRPQQAPCGQAHFIVLCEATLTKEVIGLLQSMLTMQQMMEQEVDQVL